VVMADKENGGGNEHAARQQDDDLPTPGHGRSVA